MARSLGRFLVLILLVSICDAAAVFQPISDSHRSAALELFTPVNGSFGSLEETYEALRTFEVLGVEKKPDIRDASCASASKTLESSTSSLKDLFFALKVNGILKCKMNEKAFEGIVSRLKAAVNDANSLLGLYHSIGSLVLIKKQTSKADLHLADAEGVFRSIKALSQSDGRWRYSSSNPQSSAFAAGIALETLAGVVTLSSSEIDQSVIGTLKNDVLKLFDGIEKYYNGAFYFDEKLIDSHENQGSISTTSSVVRGITALGAVTAESLNLLGDKILGLAKFFLGIGTPGDAKDFFNQIDSLACLENNRVSIPLILSLPSTVLSLTKKDSLKLSRVISQRPLREQSELGKLLDAPIFSGSASSTNLQTESIDGKTNVRVNTVLGSSAPPLTVKLVGAFSSGSKDTPLIDSQELMFNSKTGVHILNDLPKSLDVGSYTFTFEIVLHESEPEKVYATGSQTKVPIVVTGLVKIENAEIAVLDSDLGSVETQKQLDLAGNNIVSLSANHLQKLRLSFQLITPKGHAFKPHQALLKLRHESKVEHIFVVGSSGKQFQLVLDFLGLVEKFFYLSGRYDIELTVGDAVMENSLLRALGHIELDLPEPPEKAPRPPPQPVDPYSRYGPKAEITHIFRAPEKRSPEELSLTFLGLTILPLLGFLIGLLRLGVNLKNFPTKAVPAIFALLFHFGIGAVLLLYVLFWLKLDLFTTLKALSLLGAFLVFVGHRILSYLAATSSKLKSA